MRKITLQILQALEQGKPLSPGNTTTDGNRVWLHGNLIAEFSNNKQEIMLTLAGWNSVTTRERLNALCNHFNIPLGFTQRNFEPKLIVRDDLMNTSELDIKSTDKILYNFKDTTFTINRE